MCQAVICDGHVPIPAGDNMRFTVLIEWVMAAVPEGGTFNNFK